MRVRGTPTGREPKPLSAVLFDIKSRAPEQKVTRDVLANRAGQLLDRIREAMLEEVKGLSERLLGTTARIRAVIRPSGDSRSKAVETPGTWSSNPAISPCTCLPALWFGSSSEGQSRSWMARYSAVPT